MSAPQATSASAAPLRACYEDWDPYIAVARSPLYDSAAAAAMEGATGVVAMLVRAAALRFGETVSFHRRSLAACRDGVARSRYDMLLVDADGRGAGLRVPTPVAYWVLAAVLPASSPLTRFESMEDFRGLRFLPATGYIYPPPIAAFDGWRTLEPREAELGPRIVARERADLFIDDLSWLRGAIEKERLGGQLKILTPPIAIAPQHIIVDARRPALAAQFEAALASMALSGEIERAYTVALDWTPREMLTLAPVAAGADRSSARRRKALVD